MDAKTKSECIWIVRIKQYHMRPIYWEYKTLKGAQDAVENFKKRESPYSPADYSIYKDIEYDQEEK